MQSVPIDLTRESDAGLLYLIGEATDEPSEKSLARDAMREFHARHYPYVSGRLGEFARNLGSVVVDVEKFTFEKAFRAAKRFKDTSPGNHELAARKARAWMGRIASNLARDELKRISRKQCGIQLVPLNDDIDAAIDSGESDEAESPEPTDSHALAQLRAILATLKVEERDILITYATFGNPTATGRELPPDVRDALEERTGYERSNIRQKWRRLSKRLEVEIEPFLTI
jgi:DNA-directed RNA polymerase specialized sigma24 family protein